MLTATGVAVLLQDVILLVLAVIGLLLGFPVVIVLRRLPARIQRLVLVTYVITSGVAMAIAWGIGGIPKGLTGEPSPAPHHAPS